MSTALATQNGSSPGEIMERVIAAGDLSKLSPEQRAQYVVKVCETAGMNPLTKPFDVIPLNGKLTLYATKGATDQLRKIHGVTLRIVEKERIDDVYMVTVEATTPDGRTDTDIGVVTLGQLKGDALANALMKALTKAKRRVTLSICGLGLLDESEFETMPARAFNEETPAAPHSAATAPVARPERPAVTAEVVDQETGEIGVFDPATATQKEINAQIDKLRKELGWTPAELKAFAAEMNIGRDREGTLLMVAHLEEKIWMMFDNDDDDEAAEAYEAQPVLLDAETRPIDRWADS